MTGDNSNDNDAARADTWIGDPDPHGQAAMLLVESLLHSLITRSLLTIADAVEIVDAAVDVKQEIGIEMDESQATLEKSLNILRAISASLSLDLPR